MEMYVLHVCISISLSLYIYIYIEREITNHCLVFVCLIQRLALLRGHPHPPVHCPETP